MSPAKTVQQFDLPPGRSLGGHYEVVKFLGAGWEGEVYKVAEIQTGIERAAKIFYPQRNPRGRTLLRYARKLNRLKHVQIIIRYHHLDTAKVRGQKVEFMVSEYVDGEMLASFIARQPGHRLRSFEALSVLHALASGIAPMHHVGEYHGDIHSENIMIRRSGIGFMIKLLDFFDLGRPSREKIQDDVVDLAHILFELIGGRQRYSKAGPEIRHFVCGLRPSLIARKFKTAGELKQAIDNLEWP